MNKPVRSEQAVFSDLVTLCTKPGYIHAIANFCFRDNVILYSGEMKEADMRKMFSPSRLIRTEISTLLGLMIKGEVDWRLPSPKTVQEYMDETEQLLNELHQCLSGEGWSGLTQESVASGFDPFERGAAFREPIFYSGEAAYTFQYLDMAILKYAADTPWLQQAGWAVMPNILRINELLGIAAQPTLGGVKNFNENRNVRLSGYNNEVFQILGRREA